MAYRPSKVADYFIKKYGGSNSDLTPMKLIKLVYIAHGWHLGITNEALIDENPEAWKYGPVIPSLYHEYKHYGNSPINKNIGSEIEFDKQGVDKLLDKIWEVYGNFSATELSAKTHQIDTPWSAVWNNVNNGNYISLQIPETYIKDYYKKLLLLRKSENVGAK